MPVFLKLLSVIGTAAMIWVGGSIIVHGLEEYGLPAIGHAIHHAAEVVGHALAPIGGAAEWTVSAAGSGVVGVVVGAALIPPISRWGQSGPAARPSPRPRRPSWSSSGAAQLISVIIRQSGPARTKKQSPPLACG
jgi:hypothetical protein